MDTRKLIKFGNSSHVISMPGSWIKKNNLNKGDLIYLEENGNNEVILSPEKKEAVREDKVVTISTNGKDLDRLNREIVSSYLNNYRVIRLKGNNIKELAPGLKTRIQNLMGLEIIDQNKEVVVAKDLLDLSEVSLFDIMKRMDIITRAMLSDLGREGKIDVSEFNQRDESVNRLYFAALRTIRKALDDPLLRKNMDLTNGDLLKIWHLIHHIETIADEIKYLGSLIRDTTSSKKEINKFFTILDETGKLYIETMKSIYKKEEEAAYILSQRKEKLLRKCDEFCGTCKGNLCASYERLKNIIREVHKVGRRIYS